MCVDCVVISVSFNKVKHALPGSTMWTPSSIEMHGNLKILGLRIQPLIKLKQLVHVRAKGRFSITVVVVAMVVAHGFSVLQCSCSGCSCYCTANIINMLYQENVCKKVTDYSVYHYLLRKVNILVSVYTP